MAKPTECSVAGCTAGPPFTRGWCRRHYTRWWRHGDPSANLKQREPWDRIDVGHPLGCWEWTGPTNANGYGRVTVRGARWVVHRWVFSYLRGPIPAGLTLDHLCRNRRCCNPDHLEPVTQEENYLRGEHPWVRRMRKNRAA